MSLREILLDLKVKFIVWYMITFKKKPKALPGFDAVKAVRKGREECP